MVLRNVENCDYLNILISKAAESDSCY